MRSRRSVRQRKNQHPTQIGQKAFSRDMLSYIEVFSLSGYRIVVHTFGRINAPNNTQKNVFICVINDFFFWSAVPFVKLMKGSLVQASGEPIPLVVESCIRFINLHGNQSFRNVQCCAKVWACKLGLD